MCQKKKKYTNSKSIENENEKCTNESTSIRYHTFLHRLQPQSYTNNFAPLRGDVNYKDLQCAISRIYCN